VITEIHAGALDDPLYRFLRMSDARVVLLLTREDPLRIGGDTPQRFQHLPVILLAVPQCFVAGDVVALEGPPRRSGGRTDLEAGVELIAPLRFPSAGIFEQPAGAKDVKLDQ
jgi:hypothetical protein